MAIKQIDLTKPNPAQPLDFVAEQARAAQMSAIAQALMQQSMGVTQPSFSTSAGNPYSIDVPNISGPVGNVLDAMRSRQEMEAALKKQEAIELATQERTRTEVGGIIGALRGRPGTPEEMGVGPEGETRPGTPGKPGDYYEATRLALSGTTPTAQNWGKELAKGVPTPENFLSNAQYLDPEGMAAFAKTLDPSVLKGRIKATIEEGIVTFTQDGRVMGKIPVTQWGPVKEVAPGVTASEEALTGKKQFAPVQTVPGRLDAIMAETNAKKLLESNKVYDANVGKYGTVLQIQTDLEQIPEASFGTAATAKILVNRFLEAVGGPKLDANAGMETIKAEFEKLLLGGDLKSLYPVTNTDLEVMRNMMGTEGLTKRTVTRMMEILGNSLNREMAVHTNFVKNFPLPPGMTRDQLMEMYAPSFKFTPIPTLPGVPPQRAGPSATTPETSPHPPSTNKWANATDEELRKEIERIKRAKGIR